MSHLHLLPITSGGTGSATASAARTALGLAIGTDVQAYHANLAAEAGLSGAADKLGYYTGAGAKALTDFTALARTVLGRATAALMRADLSLDTGNSPTFTNLTLTGNLTVQGSRTVIQGEKTALSDNYIDLNAKYTTTAAQSGGIVVNYDPIPGITNAIAAGGFIAGIDATSNPTVEVTAAGAFAQGEIVIVDGSTSNDGLYEVEAILTVPDRIRIKGVGTVAAAEDWSGNQFTTEAGAGNIYKTTVSVIRCGTDGIWETGSGSTVPITYTDVQGTVLAGNGLSKTSNTLDVNVDDSTIEINTDTLRVKDSGITNAKIVASAGIPSSKLSTTAFTPNTATSTEATNADDLGSDANRWDGYFKAISHKGELRIAGGAKIAITAAQTIKNAAGDSGLADSERAIIILVSNAGASYDLTLPAPDAAGPPVGDGRVLWVKKIDNNANPIVIKPPSGKKLENAVDGTYSLDVFNESIKLVADNTNGWQIW